MAKNCKESRDPATKLIGTTQSNSTETIPAPAPV